MVDEFSYQLSFEIDHQREVYGHELLKQKPETERLKAGAVTLPLFNN